MNLMDFEVLNLGGWRKKLLLRAVEQAPCTLIRHHEGRRGAGLRDELYASALSSTLDWLKPQEIVDKVWSEKDRREALMEVGRKSLPKSHEMDPVFVDQALQTYNKEMPFQDVLFVEHYRLFAHFMKKEFAGHKLIPLMSYEIERGLLESREFLKPRLQKDEVAKNPTLVVVDHRHTEIDFLPEKALYLMSVDPTSEEVKTFPVLPDEARILDVFEEDVRMTIPQVLEFLKDEKRDSNKSWESIIHNLIHKGWIIKYPL